jgi:hypothetical protein
MRFKVLPPELTRLLTKDEEDILTPRADKRAFAVGLAPCSRCGGKMQQKLNTVQPFTPEEPLPRTFAVCDDCGFAYDPHSGLVVAMGNPAKVEDPFSIPESE